MKALPSGKGSCAECGWLSYKHSLFQLEPNGRIASQWSTICLNTKEWCKRLGDFKDGIPKQEQATGLMLMRRRIRWNWLAKIK